MAIIMKSTMTRTAEEVLDLMEKLQAYLRGFQDYWISNAFDIVITPATPLPALPHKFSNELFLQNAYLMLFNLLDYPSGVLPIKLVRQEDLHFPNPRPSNPSTRCQDRMSHYSNLAL